METQRQEEREHPRLGKGGLCLLGLSFLAAVGLQFIHPAGYDWALCWRRIGK